MTRIPILICTLAACLVGLAIAPSAASAQGTAAQLLAELASGDSTRCMDAGNATSEHQEHYQALAAELAPTLVRMVEENAPCAGSAISALVNLGPGIASGVPASRAVPALAAIVEAELSREFTDQTGSAILVIGHYGPQAGAAVPVLERVLRERSEYHDRSYALMTLAAIGDAAAPAAAAVVELLAPSSPEDEDAWQKDQLRADALRALAAMPAAIDRSGPHLAAALAGEDPTYASLAHDSLVAVGSGAVPHVVPLLAQPGADVRERGLRVLAAIGAPAAEAVPAVLQLLGDEEWNVSYQAREVLLAVGPTPTVVDGLAKKVEGSDEDVAVVAAELLGGFGDGAKPALPALRRAAGSDSWQLKMAAQSAVERIETPQ
jgi:HEAT repeat protein